MSRRRALAAAVGLAAVFAGSLVSGAEAGQTRIVGGKPAMLSQWPWVARVVINNPGGINVCSGTVVAPNVVLTAGHCWTAAWRFAVTTGTTSATSGGQTSAVSTVVTEPRLAVVKTLDGTTLHDYDAALLELAKPTTAPAVNLATPEDGPLYRAGTAAAVAGWGWETHGSTTLTQTLQQAAAKMDIKSQPTCRSDSAVEFGHVLNTLDQFCAIAPTGTTGICQGDSGGPLVVPGANGDPEEIGITIWDANECSTRDPDYFTKVAAISGWLTQEICKLSLGAEPVARHACAGAYNGRTRQDRAVSITVAASQTHVIAASATLKLRCTRLRQPLTYTAAASGSRYWPLRIGAPDRLDFSDSFRGPLGWHVSLQATFTNHTTAAGVVTVTGTSPHDGACSSGNVRWTARLA